MTVKPTFDSYTDRGEDVVLWRALGSLAHGHYVDAGNSTTTSGSTSRAFYDAGWSGLLVVPDGDRGAPCIVERPRDVVVEANRRRRIGTILDEVGWRGKEIHFLSFDAEAAKALVDAPDPAGVVGIIEDADLAAWRPWVVVVDTSTAAPSSSERSQLRQRMADSHYEQTMFDGTSCWFAEAAKSALLAEQLSYPAHPSDSYTTPTERAWRDRERSLLDKLASLEADVAGWRSKAVTEWASVRSDKQAQDVAAAALQTLDAGRSGNADEIERLQAELAEIRASTSWQVTAPLRRATSLIKRRK